jgi:phosphoribosylformylglycinamidine cyclo-ligase
MTIRNGPHLCRSGRRHRRGQRAGRAHQARRGRTRGPASWRAGGFGALFDLKAAGYRDPILVAATDGVGTKLRIAIDTGLSTPSGSTWSRCASTTWSARGRSRCSSSTISRPASSTSTQAARIIGGIAEGCAAAGCALIGGETAEMPGMYAPGTSTSRASPWARWSAARRCPRAWPRATCFWGSPRTGCIPTAIRWCAASWSGRAGLGRARALRTARLGAALLAPTRLYVRPALAAIRAGGVHALAHITGGGLTENLPRILPEGLGADDRPGAWALPPVFGWLARKGGLERPRCCDLQLRHRHGAGRGGGPGRGACGASARRGRDGHGSAGRAEGQGVAYRGALA